MQREVQSKIESFVKIKFSVGRSYKFIKEKLAEFEKINKQIIKFIDNHETQKVIFYRCQGKKCPFILSFKKNLKYYKLNSINLQHSCNKSVLDSSFLFKQTLRLIKNKSDFIFSEYFEKKVNQNEKTLFLTRPRLILDDLKNKHGFSIKFFASSLSDQIKLKKKFDNIIQNMRKQFKQKYPDVTCISDPFQEKRTLITQQKYLRKTEEIENSELQTDWESQFLSQPDSLPPSYCDHEISTKFENNESLSSPFKYSTFNFSCESTQIEQENVSDQDLISLEPVAKFSQIECQNTENDNDFQQTNEIKKKRQKKAFFIQRDSTINQQNVCDKTNNKQQVYSKEGYFLDTQTSSRKQIDQRQLNTKDETNSRIPFGYSFGFFSSNQYF